MNGLLGENRVTAITPKKAVGLIKCIGMTIIASACLTTEFARAANCQVAVSVRSGWNLLALPLEPTDPDFSAVFASAIGSIEEIRLFDAVTRTWKVGSFSESWPTELNDSLQIHAGTGVWIRANDPVVIYYDGEPDLPGIPIANGWTLAGLVGFTPKTIEALVGADSDSIQSVWTWDSQSDSYQVIAIDSASVIEDDIFLRPFKAAWVSAIAELSVDPPVAALLAGHVSAAGGIWSSSQPYDYGEHSFESAGFDIDREPLGCYGDEDTDAWDADGNPSTNDFGKPGPNGTIDPPVSGRFKMQVSLGGPLIPAGAADGQKSFSLVTGSAALFFASNRPDLHEPSD